MSIFNPIIKFLIRIFCSIVIKNSIIKKYVFESVLKTEISNFYEKGFFAGYRHIDKGIDIAHRFKLGIPYVIVDVGGSKGKTATIFSKGQPGQKIYVFEPIKSNFTEITKLLSDYSGIIPVNKALGNEEGTAKINIASRISASSLLELKADKQSEVFSTALEKVNVEEIIISRLDDEIPKNENISILKIDVQGYEMEVLNGAESCLKRTSIIILEISNHGGYMGSPKYFEIDEKLRKFGFILYDILPSTFDKGQLVEWDTIYLSKVLLNS